MRAVTEHSPKGRKEVTDESRNAQLLDNQSECYCRRAESSRRGTSSTVHSVRGKSNGGWIARVEKLQREGDSSHSSGGNQDNRHLRLQARHFIQGSPLASIFVYDVEHDSV